MGSDESGEMVYDDDDEKEFKELENEAKIARGEDISDEDDDMLSGSDKGSKDGKEDQDGNEQFLAGG